MWARIEVIPSEHNVICLPPFPILNYKRQIQISFGAKSVRSRIQFYDNQNAYGKYDFSFYTDADPLKIGITSKIKDKLLIPDTLIYRIKVSVNKIMIGPVIGLLLGENNDVYTPRHMEKYSDRFGIYDKVGGLIYAFSPNWINWDNNTTYGLYYNISKSVWEYGDFPLPDVIYRRDFHTGLQALKKLVNLTNNKLFNSYRFSKTELYEFICKDTGLNPYLPHTELVQDINQIRTFISRYSKVIFKPNDLSRGRGIFIIEKIDLFYKLTDYRDKRKIKSYYFDEKALENFFLENHDLYNVYLIQQYIPLAQVGSSPFDIRVVMQKAQDTSWKCTGIECRVAHTHSHITNIARGGYASHLEDILHKAFPAGCSYESVKQQIYEFCEKICLRLDGMGEHFAEFGLDIALDKNGKLWLIEANVFPSFKGFKSIDCQTYLSIRYTPFLYALSISGFIDKNK